MAEISFGGDLPSSDLDENDVVEDNNDSNSVQKLPSMDSTDSASSDSSVDDIPQKKKRSTTRRGLSALLDSSSMPVLGAAEESHVYSTRVRSVMGGFKLGQGQLSSCGSITATRAGSDVEDDEASIFRKRPSKKQSRAGAGSRGRGGRGKASAKAVNRTPQKYEPYKEQLINLDSDSGSEEENRNRLNQQPVAVGSFKSPSPPPAPPSPPRLYSRPQQKKALKDAYKELQRAQVMNCGRDDDDADVSIVEITSPPPDHPRSKPITVKVRSRSGIQRFTVKSGDPFTNLIQAMAGHEYVPVDRVIMFLADRTIEPYDTPGSLGLGIADIIECHILRPGETTQSSQPDTTTEDDPDVINIKVQGKGAKSRMLVPVRKDEGLGKLMKKYAESQSISLDSLKFEFDGEEVFPQDTPDELELEENFCIDVIVGAH